MRKYRYSRGSKRRRTNQTMMILYWTDEEPEGDRGEKEAAAVRLLVQ